MPSANDIRRQFIDFFVRRHGHTEVPSSSVVPLDDPTLLFTNAGMNQFKDVFLGTGTRPYRRAVDSQKCIRAGGKHNDLEDVGRDTYHHTFFEMLGNWSFGDYFKKEAIAWAWELLTKVWGLDKGRLHATVFEGGDGLARDDEAAELWRTQTDIDPAHIHRGSKKDNFWVMGDTGPCGPCSEIHYDRTPDKSGGKLVNKGDARVIEIWNLVFIQFNRDDKGVLHPLPAKHVDTGMGFERITAVLQGKESNYDTDVFAPLMRAIGELTGKQYGGRLDDLTDVGFRVIADHLRMLTFAITDGALPGNKGRGSVLRSVLRRAVRFGWQVFGQREPFMYKLVPALVDHMGGAYPELKKNPGRVEQVIKGEEADFLRTIERGLSLFDKVAQQAEREGGVISGKAIFDLHTTYGFYPDLTRQMAQERGLKLDEEGYQKLWTKFTEGTGAQAAAQVALNVSGGLPETDDRPKWQGMQAEAKILGWIADNQFHKSGAVPEGQEVGLLLDRTCFYAEQGGQVGDRGTVATPTGTFEVEQTVKVGNAVAHVGRVSAGRVEVGQQAFLKVDPEREFTRKNHTATHLLHWALHQVLGEHVEQRGSKVKPDEFTFDFSHTGPLTDEEKRRVERLVNEKVYQDLPVTWRELSQAEAKKLPGVRAFFGDKYGDVVRVVEVHDAPLAPSGGRGVGGEGRDDVFSREFCGGTHLEHTGQIGYFKIVGEEAVGKGVRRLVCVTGPGAVAAVQKEDGILAELTGRFRCKPEELPARIDALQEEIKKLQQQLKKGAAADVQGAADRLLAEAAEVGGAKLIVGEVPAAPEEALRQQIDRLRQKAGSAVVVLGWTDDGKVGLMAAATDDLVKKGAHAGKLVGEAAKVVGGKGGGRPNMAQAGGKEPAKLGEALQLAKKLAGEQLS
ncbi:MAG TPA: alanine--tRNA ligase [Gemmataceae bacterium]|nr:alanine--tRNA ligase [Gemmataceae bacterium]